MGVIGGRGADRIPVYGWVGAKLGEQISEAFGSVRDFEDRYEFDYAHLFGGPGPHLGKYIEPLREAKNGAIEPSDVLDMPMGDPNDESAYDSLRAQIEHHKVQRGRFIYVQTPGLFECLNGLFGIEKHLMYLAMYESDLHEVYRRQAEWNR